MTFNGFIPPESNYSKLPHALINQLPEVESMAELKVIIYILRHTWGFSEFGAPKKMTTDEICKGRKRRDQTRLDNGTGLSENAARDGINKAVEHGFLTVETDEIDAARIKKYYALRMISSSTSAPSTANVAPLGAEVEERTEKETIRKKSTPVTAKELAQADKVVDAILAQSELAKNSYAGREKLPDSIRELVDAFVSETKIKPTKKEIMGWMSECGDWLDFGANPADISPALAYAKSKGYAIMSPFSLTNTLRAYKAGALPKEKINPIVPIYHAPADDTQYTPNPKRQK